MFQVLTMCKKKEKRCFMKQEAQSLIYDSDHTSFDYQIPSFFDCILSL